MFSTSLTFGFWTTLKHWIKYNTYPNKPMSVWVMKDKVTFLLLSWEVRSVPALITLRLKTSSSVPLATCFTSKSSCTVLWMQVNHRTLYLTLISTKQSKLGKRTTTSVRHCFSDFYLWTSFLKTDGTKSKQIYMSRQTAVCYTWQGMTRQKWMEQ
jgi:hypothetical protein